MSNKPDDVIRYRIKVNSKPLAEDMPICSILIDKHVNKIPYAKISIYDGDLAMQAFEIANDKTFAVGSDVTIEAGYGDGDLKKLFEGVIVRFAIKSNQDRFSTFIITCKDVAFKTTISPKIAHYEKIKDSDLFKKVLQSYRGIKSQLETTMVIHESLVQYEVSDWDFLNIRAEAIGKIVVVDDGKIAIKKPGFTGAGKLAYTYGEDFIDFDAEIDVQDQWADIRALSWDSSKQRVVSAKITEPGECSMGDISYKDLVRATNKDDVVITHGGALDDEMKAMATGLLHRKRMAKVKGQVKVAGNAKLKPDMLITIKAGAKHFAGDAYVSGIRHIIVDGSWDTEVTLGLDAERYMRKYNDINTLPAAGMLPPVYGLQLGTVKKITQDPQNSYRLFVNLPLLQKKTSDGLWCRLASFYATSKSGAFFLPEIDDEVVVGFINDDLRAPVILGSLYSSKHDIPKTISSNNIYKSFISREKLEFTFLDDDKGPEIILKTPKGNTIELSDKAKSLKILDQNGNKIVLDSKGISIVSNKDITLDAKGSLKLKGLKDLALNGTQNLNLKSMNINLEASMKASLSGNASTEVKSNMATIIKGTTVLIN